MSKYSSHSGFGEKKTRSTQVHPVWRGIGLAMILLIPFLGYVSTLVILQENEKSHWFRLPTDLMMRGNSDPLILIKVILTIIIAFLLYMVISLIVFVLYSRLAPPRYGPYDAPQPSLRGRGVRRSR